MALTFPILSLNPSSFSMEPINKSLVPEDISSIFLTGRELYIGNPYSLSLKYNNLNGIDTAKLMNFYELVGTILPFQFMFETRIYNLNFTKPYQVSKKVYNLFDVALQMQTNFAYIDKWLTLETNLAKRWYSLTDFPYYMLNGYSSILNYVVCAEVTNRKYINNESIEINPPINPTWSGLSCASNNNIAISFVLGATYTLTTKLTLYSGQNPFISVWSEVDSIYMLTSRPLEPNYQTIDFVATSLSGYILVNNDKESVWSLVVELIRKA